MKCFKLVEFCSVVSKFGDTLIPMRKHFGSKSCKLTTLGAEFIPNWNIYQSKAHSALFDVWATIQILKIEKIKISQKDFRSVYQLAPNAEIRQKMIKIGRDGFDELINFGIISTNEAKHIIEQGTTVQTLKRMCLQNENELEHLLDSIYSKNQLERKLKKIKAFFKE